MNKLLSKLLEVIGLVTSIYLIIDFFAWLIAGVGVMESVSGASSPVIVAIAEHITGMPQWAFWIGCLVSVLLLAVILALFFLSYFVKGGKK